MISMDWLRTSLSKQKLNQLLLHALARLRGKNGRPIQQNASMPHSRSRHNAPFSIPPQCPILAPATIHTYPDLWGWARHCAAWPPRGVQCGVVRCGVLVVEWFWWEALEWAGWNGVAGVGWSATWLCLRTLSTRGTPMHVKHFNPMTWSGRGHVVV
jgi:hypothetical protein